MFRWVSKIIYSDGYRSGKAVIDADMRKQIDELKRETKRLTNDLTNERANLSKIIADNNRDKIQAMKDTEKELSDIKREYREETHQARESKRIYDEKINQIQASEAYIRNHLETRSQIDMTAISRMSADIDGIKEATKSELKKI